MPMPKPMWVIILDPWKDEPVYHADNGNSFVGRGQTKCGREIGAYKPYLPFKHVVKFARPCRGCFGGESL
jgi:hypothetical protein